MFSPCELKVQRLNNGHPIISPTSNWWENSVTFNPAVIYLEKSKQTEPLIKNLLGDEDGSSKYNNGIVVIHYRARPSDEKNVNLPPNFSRSFSGLAVCTPDLKLIRRYGSPVIWPDEDRSRYDYMGVEDGRLHFLDGNYYYLYCGVGYTDKPIDEWGIKAQLCLAKSKDLLKWDKLGPLKGSVNSDTRHNKDGVIFPGKIDGHYFMLHRPCAGKNYSRYAIALAMSDKIEGQWTDLGIIKYAAPVPSIAKHVWVGAGSVPIFLGNKRFLVIYHRGHLLHNGDKWYDLHAAIFNFNRFDSSNPGNIIEKRLERLLVPETSHEKVASGSNGVANVVFTCGCYEYNGYLYILYGGADSCTLAAKVKKTDLLQALESSKEVMLGI